MTGGRRRTEVAALEPILVVVASAVDVALSRVEGSEEGADPQPATISAADTRAAPARMSDQSLITSNVPSADLRQQRRWMVRSEASLAGSRPHPARTRAIVTLCGAGRGFILYSERCRHLRW